MRAISLLAVLPMLLLVNAACAPAYRTEYHYLAPEYADGRDCVAQCRVADRQCRQQPTDEAKSDYEKCTERAYADYSECRRHRRPGQEGGTCYRPVCVVVPGGEPRLCEQAVQDCFEDCGGTIEVRKICEAHC